MVGTLRIDEESLTTGLLTLVVTLVEIIQEALEAQAIRRIEGGSLTEEEQDRLGNALLELDEAMAKLKKDHGIADSVDDLRSSLDSLVADLVAQATDAQGTDRPGDPPGLLR